MDAAPRRRRIEASGAELAPDQLVESIRGFIDQFPPGDQEPQLPVSTGADHQAKVLPAASTGINTLLTMGLLRLVRSSRTSRSS